MRSLTNYSKLCVHTQTNKPWTIEECITQYAAAGISAISIWRHLLEGKDLSEIKELLIKNEMEVVALVRGGFFPSVDDKQRALALEDNRLAMEQAAALGAPQVVLVCGADPNQSLKVSRQQIKEGITALLPQAERLGVKLSIEPLHPMYAGDKSAISSLGQANDLCEEIDSPWVGVAIDVYHLWWDDQLEKEISRCGKSDNIFAFHVCDWRVPTTDFLTDRGLMGEGCIPVKQIREWVEKAGFDGYNEVEVFSERLWAQDQKLYLEDIKKAYLNYI
ncbi:MAG: sugar phosphate isomerase/epimerase [Flavobacteriaceae bacterium]|jgi:sugar phosphate isomerase/epimerase|nr:sugar phosphate isomerase/epimerase [Flavobacteriaceae bacterium]MDG1967849.1 sugar phosphate isomerase/epimerase [Flavobacteriaceae bacterium]